MIEVCTVFAPMPDHPKWRDDYLSLLHAQRHSAIRAGHTHAVVTPAVIAGLDCLVTDLGEDLMRAMLLGVLYRLERPVATDIVFVDVDCLINRPLGNVFRKSLPFDVALTMRPHAVSRINNGVMYVRQSGVAGAIMFFREALRLCQSHWGGDQEAISQAAAPVPDEPLSAVRCGCRIGFLSAKHYAPTPKERLVYHEGAPVVHFKGETKDWMLDYAREFQGWAA